MKHFPFLINILRSCVPAFAGRSPANCGTKACFLFCLPAFLHPCYAQETFPVNGIRNKEHLYHAFTNATIIVDYQTSIPNGAMLIRDGFIEAVGKSILIPEGAAIHDLHGQYIYPSFIDVFSGYGIQKENSVRLKKRNEDESFPERTGKGAFGWNQAIRPETEAAKLFHADSAAAEEYRSLGFGAVLTHNPDGIARGTAALVYLGAGRENELIILEKAAAHYSFDKGSSKQEYPSSLMGAIALLRQTFLDAQWYKPGGEQKEKNISLEAWNAIRNIPLVFEVSDKLNALRADRVGDEFGVQYIIKGAGNEYQRLDEIKNTNAPFILPLNFLPAFDVSDPYDAMQVSLAELKHWELAPYNPYFFQTKQIPFALTSYGLKNKKDFKKNLSKAIEYGLTPQDALKALTFTPARLLHAEDKIGSLKKGLLANFIITSDSLFKEDAFIYQNWIQGKQYIINDERLIKLKGIYDLFINGKSFKLTVKINDLKPQATVETADTVKINNVISVNGNLITINLNPSAKSAEKSGLPSGSTRLSGNIEYTPPVKFSGRGQLPDGIWVEWSAAYKSPLPPEKISEKKKPSPSRMPDTLITYPFNAYGWKVPPVQESYLIKNATVWTNEPEGILKETDVLIDFGKISKTGKNIPPPVLSSGKLNIIDATGKHLTAGIIDEHSHIAVSGNVNEGTQAVSAEVRIGDVVNSEDINIYRQLGGGVTASHLLHGSANPIGGQTALIKLKWGFSSEKMKIENNAPFIKFALGENVKQSNWGDRHNYRYPQTRMGVEQIIYDGFILAREYDNKWKKYNGMTAKEKAAAPPPRRDLELETLAEILNKKRFITCHSYVQSEINMLLHVADSMHFKVNTFTHVLEGYKVADKLKKHGAAASTFSDWWAYKFEVKDAIPWNASLMDRTGVVTALNSDDAEMARRLNQEAAKSIKYGGTSEENALKMVTLNPAKMLHIDNRTGSIKAGKDADVVLWSDNPLSIYAKAEKTFVDGILFYDATADSMMQVIINAERNRIIQKMLDAKQQGEKSIKPEKKQSEQLYKCGEE